MSEELEPTAQKFDLKHSLIDVEIAELKAKVAANDAEIKQLKAWKAEALTVFNSFAPQKIGRLLDLPLGVDVPSNVEPAIRKLKDELSQAKARIAELTEDRERLDWLQLLYGLPGKGCAPTKRFIELGTHLAHHPLREAIDAARNAQSKGDAT